jgi:hypothetical protein
VSARLSRHRQLRQLDPGIGGSGPHAFAVRLSALRRCAPKRPSHPAPNVRDDWPKRPSLVEQDAGREPYFSEKRKLNILFEGDGPPIRLNRLAKLIFARGRRARRRATKIELFLPDGQISRCRHCWRGQSIAVKRVRRLAGWRYTNDDSASGAVSGSLTDAITSADGSRLAGRVSR